ncbi:hypothetical protein [sulfur-oxidizing endosymbiont of Gigantopelta aegis]|uniref:hypothetical protein n=1 Tax=sulfur-oxidizing endosymbiont of Gigantopelta aegis TaxID=2794934 RepID=UPI0018DDEBDD|nr:hypothetical protein [sulfur-oxidizing endosymbiont of Gigantopelta aegis]
MKEWRSPLKHTYEKILDLHERNWNGIWFRIVRNFFWSAIAGKFDVVVGNLMCQHFSGQFSKFFWLFQVIFVILYFLSF